MSEFESSILKLYKKTAFQRLTAYYSQSTVFNVLGVERSEKRHSAFLEWLLNPESAHGLKELPLRKLLSLVAAKADDEYKCYYQQVREHLITGNYSMQMECVKTEQSIIGLANGNSEKFKDVVETNDNGGFKQDAQNRFDIWMLLNIKFEDENGVEQRWSLPIVVENKIYSTEGNANDPKRAQTTRYMRAVNILKNVVCPDPNYSQPLLVYLTPSDTKKGPTDQAFIHITYQDLLDHVLQPCSMVSASQASSADTRALIDGYVRNLSCPSNRDGENVKDYSILAIADTESHDLETIFASEAFKTALSAIYPNEAQVLLGEEASAVEDKQTMIDQFWNANENLFKIVLYNHFKGDEEKMKAVRKIVKVSNRDNTRYFVAVKQGAPWLNSHAASKSETSFLIFKAYCELQHEKNPSALLTLDDLRREFDCELNSYYHNRFLQYLFYDFDEEVTVDVSAHKWFGKEICPDSNTWDFYWDEAHQLPHVAGDVRNVKMWRKDDFDRLVEKARKIGIVVEPKEYEDAHL